MAVRFAYQIVEIKMIKLLNMLKDYLKTVIYQHCKQPLDGELKEDKSIGREIGRLSMVSHMDHRNIRK